MAIGLVLLAVLLGLFLWFNRIPKLDVVEADLAGVTAPAAECFQGFCLESEPDSTLFSRWWDFSLVYLKLISLGMIFAFLMAGLTEVFLLPAGSVYGTWARRGVRGSLGGLLVGPAMNLCSACIVPIANAFRQRGAGTEAALAIVHGSSTLNVPALLMAALVFTPMLAGSRVGAELGGRAVPRAAGGLAVRAGQPQRKYGSGAAPHPPAGDCQRRFQPRRRRIVLARRFVRWPESLGPGQPALLCPPGAGDGSGGVCQLAGHSSGSARRPLAPTWATTPRAWRSPPPWAC